MLLGFLLGDDALYVRVSDYFLHYSNFFYFLRRLFFGPTAPAQPLFTLRTVGLTIMGTGGRNEIRLSPGESFPFSAFTHEMPSAAAAQAGPSFLRRRRRVIYLTVTLVLARRRGRWRRGTGRGRASPAKASRTRTSACYTPSTQYFRKPNVPRIGGVTDILIGWQDFL